MIPLIIYQTWHTKELPAEMRESVNQIKKAAPEFSYMLFDDVDCLEFIQEYFPCNVVDAYNRLIPGAYKADLWRYCVLYVTGGIYIDIKYRPVPSFKLIQLTKSEHFVNDLQDAYVKVDGVYNGVMICKPQNIALLKCINEIVYNVNVSFYGRSPLEPTGPILLRKHNKFTDMQLKLNSLEQLQIFLNNNLILYSYMSYRKEQRTFEIFPHYSRLWLAKSIYRRPIKKDESEITEPEPDKPISNEPEPTEPEPTESEPTDEPMKRGVKEEKKKLRPLVVYRPSLNNIIFNSP